MSDLEPDEFIIEGLESPVRHGTHRLDLRFNVGFDSGTCVAMLGTIRGEPELHVVDALIDRQSLMAAATRSGDYIVFNCSCGCPGCGGFDSVQVEVGEDEVTWTWSEWTSKALARSSPRERDHLLPVSGPQRAVFDRQEIENQVGFALELLDAITQGFAGAGIEYERVPYECGGG